ncbi:hypothetical protein K505DRAFT_389909 [Melanomma pulvis-pyrius CBS 109.77]|uniref:Uncharacterized protein n=1 Tax=Melanomma pulvis-pyrius CBS 109.77 TaxID=1314802 RepID=A0A6A6X385_9PLEO|nr:hypothetical protein K505DRAFT_389909 [Melanomma pulvis-pyrius CBS 109.77]
MKFLVSYLPLLLYFDGSTLVDAVTAAAGKASVPYDTQPFGPSSFITKLNHLFIRDGNGRACEDRCKKRCKGRRIKDPTNCQRCISCVSGTNPDPLHITCINNDEDKKRKGNCPDDKILDPKEGPQKLDADPKDVKCAIDDEKNCKPPKIPETRPNGKENDVSFKPQCVDVDENDKTKCDDKQQFMKTTVGPDGKAKRTCKPTSQYENKKKNRWEKLKDKFKKRWEDKKDERAKKDEERKTRRTDIDDKKKRKEKEVEDKKKKKIKTYRCGMATAMVAGQEIAGLIPTKRLARRDGEGQEIDSYMDMTACYFDADFVDSDEFLDYWPSDINVDDIEIKVDEDAYMKAFEERMEDADFAFWNSHDFCKRNGTGSLEARCPRKKRNELMAKEREYEKKRQMTERALKRNLAVTSLHKRDDDVDTNDFCDMSNLVTKRDTHEAIKKRNPFAIFVEIAVFAARMATSLLSRVIPKLASFSPRLANLLAKTPKNLFKLAPKGQVGNAGSREAMKQAFRKLADHPAFRKCIRDGKP